MNNAYSFKAPSLKSKSDLAEKSDSVESLVKTQTKLAEFAHCVHYLFFTNE